MKVFQGVVGKLSSERYTKYQVIIRKRYKIPRVYSLWGQYNGHLLADKVGFFLPSWKMGLHLSILSIPGEGYSRHASCTLNLISTFLLLSRGRYLCWWTISPRGYHPLRHCHSLLDIFITDIHSSKLM